MQEKGAVNHFWDFLRKYYRNDEINRHPSCKITVKNVQKEVHPDFIVDSNSKVLFEFKELKESHVKNSHRSILIKWFEQPVDSRNSSRAVPDFVHRYIANAMKEALDQLRPAEDLNCPSVLVLFSEFRGLRVFLGQHIDFTTAMYRRVDYFQQEKTPMTKHSYISALAYFSVDESDPDMVLYRIRFYHNCFADHKLPLEPFTDRKCQHYFITKDMFWMPALPHEETLGT